MSDCIFCKIIEKKIPADIVFENESLIAFKDISPQAPVHIVIIPKHHVETVLDLTEKDSQWWAELPSAIKKIAEKENVDKKGFRLVFNCKEDGGQEVGHIHMHLLGGRSLQWPPG